MSYEEDGIVKYKVFWCICPACRKKHKVRIQWSGRGIPRIRCIQCQSNQLALEDIGFDMVEIVRLDWIYGV